MPWKFQIPIIVLKEDTQQDLREDRILVDQETVRLSPVKNRAVLVFPTNFLTQILIRFLLGDVDGDGVDELVVVGLAHEWCAGGNYIDVQDALFIVNKNRTRFNKVQ